MWRDEKALEKHGQQAGSCGKVIRTKEEQEEADTGPVAATIMSAVVAPLVSLLRRRMHSRKDFLVGAILYSNSCPLGARIRGPPIHQKLRKVSGSLLGAFSADLFYSGLYGFGRLIREILKMSLGLMSCYQRSSTKYF